MLLWSHGRQSLTLSIGGQRWLLPNVATGAKDWLAAGELTYGTRVKRVPIFITENSWSLLKSTLRLAPPFIPRWALNTGS
jgi:hypothetical protein